MPRSTTPSQPSTKRQRSPPNKSLPGRNRRFRHSKSCAALLLQQSKAARDDPQREDDGLGRQAGLPQFPREGLQDVPAQVFVGRRHSEGAGSEQERKRLRRSDEETADYRRDERVPGFCSGEAQDCHDCQSEQRVQDCFWDSQAFGDGLLARGGFRFTLAPRHVLQPVLGLDVDSRAEESSQGSCICGRDSLRELHEDCAGTGARQSHSDSDQRTAGDVCVVGRQ